MVVYRPKRPGAPGFVTAWGDRHRRGRYALFWELDHLRGNNVFCLSTATAFRKLGRRCPSPTAP